MTKRERVLSVLCGKKPDKLPWFGDLSYWAHYLNATDNMPEKYKKSDGIYRLHEDLGVGYHLQGYYPFTVRYEEVVVQEEELGEITVTTYNTPVGTLRERWQYSSKTFSNAPLEYLVKDITDLPALRYLYEHAQYEPNYDEAEKRQKYIGGNGITMCYTPRTPFMEMVVQKAGIEALAYCVADDPDEFEWTLDVIGKSFEKAVNITVAAPCDCVMVPENLSSEVVGKEYYHQHVEPYHHKWTQLIKKHGKFSFIHMDGTLKGLISEVSHSGFQVLEALTPEPVGDLPLEDFIYSVSGDVIVWGGLPGAFFTQDFPDKDFDAFVIKAIKLMTQNTRFVLGVADQVPPYATFERIKRVNELVERYG